MHYKTESYAIIGAAVEVYKELGKGFLESVYHEALTIELASRNIPYKSEMKLPVLYKSKQLSQYFIADLVCYDNIILELKAQKQLTESHKAQVFNYLKASRIKLGLLINFGLDKLDIKRIVL